MDGLIVFLVSVIVLLWMFIEVVLNYLLNHPNLADMILLAFLLILVTSAAIKIFIILGFELWLYWYMFAFFFITASLFIKMRIEQKLDEF